MQSRFRCYRTSTRAATAALLAAALAACAALGAAAQDGQAPASNAPEADPYAECARLLDGPPLNTLHEFVAEGRGAWIGSTELGEPLTGLRCSDEQIIAFMVREGFEHSNTRTWPEPERTGWGTIDKQIGFGIRSSPLGAWFWGHRYSVGSRFLMLGDRIVWIVAGANK